MKDLLKKLKINEENYGCCIGGENWLETKTEGVIDSINPSSGDLIAKVFKSSEQDYDKVIQASNEAFKEWRMVQHLKEVS